MAPHADARLWQALAELLDYPAGNVAALAREAATLLAPLSPEGAAVAARFAVFAEAAPRGEVEEAYTRAFDLESSRCPYVGFHLFGESYKRSVFLLRLKAEARARGVDLRGELADHLAVLLRLLAASPDPEFRAELASEAILPALGRMVASAPRDGAAPPADPPGPYRALLEAVRLALEACYPATPAGAGLTTTAPAS